MNLVVVDDEKMIREGIAYYVEQLNLGFDSIRTASTGVELLKTLDTFCPDVIIIDILMPELNGIQTLEALYKRYPNVQVIIISGYNEFDYVQASLRFETVDYILKPIDADKLHEALLRAIEKYYAFQKSREQETIIENYAELLPMLQRNYLSVLMSNGCSDREYLGKTLKSLKLSEYLNRRLILYATAPTNEIEKNVAVLCIILDELKKNFPNEQLIWINGDWVVSLFAVESQSQIEDTCRRMENAMTRIKMDRGLRISSGFAVEDNGIFDLDVMYNRACQAMSIADVTNVDVLEAKDLFDGVVENGFWIHEDMRDLIRKAMMNSDFEFVRQMIDGCFSDEQGEASERFQQMKMAALHLCTSLTPVIMDNTKLLHLLQGVVHTDTVAQLRDGIGKWISQVKNSGVEANNSRLIGIVDKMKNSIQERYQEQLSLQTFSNETGLSIGYLSQAFNQIVGMSFIHYLTECRMAHAVSLLANPMLSIQTVAVKSGYESANYFGSSRKVEGLTEMR